MRKTIIVLLSTVACATTAHAEDKPLIAPPPAWVKPVAIPAAPADTSAAAVQVLLSDQQVYLQPGKQTAYVEVALKIQTPQGLAAGNISFPWRPDTDVLTVHKLLIRRGDKIIDVLASGQTFTVLRRETNLEIATLDGVLTANIQPEGLQVGDVIDFAASLASSDPVMRGHVEQSAGGWGGPITRAHLRVSWPSTLPLRWHQTEGVPTLKPVKSGGVSAVDFSLDTVQPLVPPKLAPARFRLGRTVDVTDFASWADLGTLLAPLYAKAATIPAQGPLRAELDKIRAASADPKQQAQAALLLVQDRVRYVALAMGTGGLVPADAKTTWSRRYGDCKGKTALLLALLHELHIQAEPVAVNAISGDGIDARLPMVGLFNHVLVRATIGSRTYWLDGTRSGDTNLDRIATPSFGWGLPLLEKDAALVRMMPAPLDTPGSETTIRIDATAGLSVPAPVTVETIIRRDDAVATRLALANLAGDARERALRDYWKGQYDFIEMKTASDRFDPATGDEHLAMTGLAKMDWSSGWYETDGTGVGYKADFSRDAGPMQGVPFAVAYPYSLRTSETILLPPGFESADAGTYKDVSQTVAGIEYRRHSGWSGTTFTIEKTERSIAPEFPASDAPAAEKALRALAEQRVYIKKPANYSPTPREVDALVATVPTTASGFVDRGYQYSNANQFDKAIADYDSALALDPKNAWALANRGLMHVWKDELDLAAKDLDAAAAIDPRNAVVFRARGLLAQARNAPQQAVKDYTTALDIEPGNAFALGRRAQANRAAGDDAAALVDAAAALKLQPSWTDLYLLRANIFRSQGKADEALKEAAAITAANPKEPFAHVTAARIFDSFHKSAEAMGEYDRAIAIKPEAYIYINRSESRPKTEFAARKLDIEAALRLEPDSADAVAAKASWQSDQGDFTGAVATYTAALAKQPGNPNLLLKRGIALTRAGQKARGEQDFTAAAAKVTDPVGFNTLCWTKAIAGVGLGSALRDCGAALKLAPDNPAYLDSRGLVLLRLGRLDEALADYDRALAKAPTQSSSLFGRALTLASKGDKAKAQVAAAAADKADPYVRERFARYGLSLNP